MAKIRTIPRKEATGDLARVYETIAGARGAIANIFQIQSLSPKTLEAHYRLYRTLMLEPGSPLSAPQRELIAVCVAQANRCHY